MITRLKKILLFTAGILTMIIIVYLSLKSQEQKAEQPTKTPIVTSEINLPEPIEGELPIGIVDEPDLITSIPSEMSLLTIKLKNINKTFIDKVAQNLAFTNLPYEISDISEGTKYVWASDEYYLWITPKKSNIRYGMNQFPNLTNNEYLSEDEIKNSAKDFITQKFEVDANTIEVSSIVSLKLSSTKEAGFIPTTANNAQMYQVNFLYKEAGYIIFTTIPSHPTIFAQVLLDGTIYKSEIYLFESFESTEQKYPILSPSEIQFYISESKLNAFLNEYLDITEIDVDDIQNIEVSNVTLGYFFNEIEISSFLHPTYLLEGNAKLKNYQADYAQLYLPAIKPSNR